MIYKDAVLHVYRLCKRIQYSVDSSNSRFPASMCEIMEKLEKKTDKNTCVWGEKHILTVNEWVNEVIKHVWLYIPFGTLIESESHSWHMNIKKYRICLSRFRCSSHDLYIEEGMYTNVDRDRRICNLRSLNKIEVEFHFLLVCPVYGKLRNILWSKNIMSLPVF